MLLIMIMIISIERLSIFVLLIMLLVDQGEEATINRHKIMNIMLLDDTPSEIQLPHNQDISSKKKVTLKDNSTTYVTNLSSKEKVPIDEVFTKLIQIASEIVISKTPPPRPQRNAITKPRKKPDPCRRLPMFVNFTDIGWNNFIFTPEGYDAYYCAGECNFPLAEHLNATNHATMQTMMHWTMPTKVPKACCVPTRYSGLNAVVLSVEDNREQYDMMMFKEMVVESCGCV